MHRQERSTDPRPEPTSPTGELVSRVEQLSRALERLNLGDYFLLIQHPWRLIWVNFLAGSARGVGIAFGFAVLSALLLAGLKSALVRNLPYIGELIAELVRLVELHRAP